jgi:hypothetical protein
LALGLYARQIEEFLIGAHGRNISFARSNSEKSRRR